MTDYKIAIRYAFEYHDVITELLHVRQRLASCELWQTYREMDAVIKAVGYEVAAKIRQYRVEEDSHS